MLSFDDLCNVMRAAINQEGGSGPDPQLMAGIALAESGGKPFSHLKNSDGSVDRGLWRINSVWEMKCLLTGVSFKEACYSPLLCARLAVLVWRKQGYEAWSTYRLLP